MPGDFPSDAQMREFHRIWVGDRHAWLLTYDSLPEDHKRRLANALRSVMASTQSNLTRIDAAVMAGCGAVLGSIAVMLTRMIL